MAVRALLDSLWHTALAFVWRGDYLPRHNVPNRAVFDALSGAGLLVGLAWAIRRLRCDSACALCLIWFAVLLTPTILAEEAPHMLRMAGILPVLFMFPALGIVAVWQTPRAHSGSRSYFTLLGLLLSASSNVAAYARPIRRASQLTMATRRLRPNWPRRSTVS